jgi:class 3 adenylate cyclase
VARFVLTIRNGPRVERRRHETLDEAIEALREGIASVLGEAALPEVRMLRTFSPEDRVKARLEISGGRVFRRREAGIDVMGDGSIVPFRGGVFRHPLEPRAEEDAVDAVAAALRE